jgi:hypothetical protein
VDERTTLRQRRGLNALVAPAAESLRLALLLDLMPRKLGSMEDWLHVMARQAAGRGHALDVFCREPVHPPSGAGCSRPGPGSSEGAPLQLLAVANLIHWKGLDVLLGALHRGRGLRPAPPPARRAAPPPAG